MKKGEVIADFGDKNAKEHLVSALGTKHYWDGRYELELKNYKEHLDEGEVWFGRSAENRILKYLSSVNVPHTARIIDLGCGNGSLLRRLRHRGFCSLMGIDYCEDAIVLARSVAEQEEKDFDKPLPPIEFQVADLLDNNLNLGAFDVLLDKGTWDAMSLSEEYNQRLFLYHSLIGGLLADNGIFIIFSCNYIKDELCHQFDVAPLRFKVQIESEHSYSFGGKKGVTSTGVVFEKAS